MQKLFLDNVFILVLKYYNVCSHICLDHAEYNFLCQTELYITHKTQHIVVQLHVWIAYKHCHPCKLYVKCKTAIVNINQNEMFTSV